MFVEAVLWIARTGSPWRDLPPEFGSWNSTYQRFARWSRAGVWHRVFRLAGARAPVSRGLHRLHHRSSPPACRWCPQKNGAQALGRSRGGLTTKIHVVVDAIGRLIQGRVSAGQVHDITQASALLEGVPAKCVVADKAYDAMALREQITAMPAKAVIPPRLNRRESIRWSKAVPSPQPRRTLLLPDQALQTHRNPLRQARRAVRLIHQSRRGHRVLGVNVNTP